MLLSDLLNLLSFVLFSMILSLSAITCLFTLEREFYSSFGVIVGVVFRKNSNRR